ncbi:hypothetical protein Zmor_021629 [Zophobas morio]|uniref:Uncharacterized protein n=1 Tax=Zophobas morio TaxID=2755281 RepID=A0AA38MB38_9CUCU|nr:hypothetical protein Zmor_021629 [Zophobas morio]
MYYVRDIDGKFPFLAVLHVRTHLNGGYHQQSSPPGYGNDRHSGPQYSPNSYHHHNNHGDSPGYQYGRFDASALHIAHALKQTELQKAYRMNREKPIDCYLVSDIGLLWLKI